ncbi:MAG: flagellar motor switch protein FliM [Planctomycetia bacterium]|nr:flagellar motor switch protein FliM [Planctomycetia bacterium]
MPDEVLSQAEVESLLTALDAGHAAPTRGKDGAPAKAGKMREKITPYDFKRPERVGKDQMRSLQTLHEGFSRNFGAALSAIVRTIVEVKLTSVDELTYSEFVFSLENPTCFNLLNAEPLEGNLILDINPSILFPMIDRLLGGGREMTPPARRPLTEIELRLVGKITEKFLEELRKAWENVLPLTLKVERVESNPQLMQIMPPNEVVVLISFEVMFNDVRGMMNLCIPFNSLERIAGRLSSNSWASYGRKYTTEDTQRVLMEGMKAAAVNVVVELARTTISTGDLIGLRVGDVVTTEHDCRSPLIVEVEGVPKFHARPGACRGRKAIRIEDVIAPQQPEPTE